MPEKVLVTTNVDHMDLGALKGAADLIQGDDANVPLSRRDVLDRLGDVVAIVNQNELRIDAALLEAAPRLRLVANTTAGFDNMDLAAMTAAGVWGSNCPSQFAAATADHVLCLILALVRRLREADAYVRSGRWPNAGWTPGAWAGTRLEGKTLGIVGFGRIGQEVARRAAAFGMVVRFHDAARREAEGFLELDELFATSDILTLHCPLTPQTRHLVSAARLRLMKPSAFVVNVARGPIVEEAALVTALREKWIAGAGLDVFEFEPQVSRDLLALDNTVFSPHMGGATMESFAAAWQHSFANVAAVLAGGPPLTPVNQPLAGAGR